MTYKDIKSMINSSGVPFKGLLNKLFDWIAGALGQNEPKKYTYEELCNLTRNHRIQVGKKYILKNYTTRLETGIIGNLSMVRHFNDTCYYDLLLTGKSSNDFDENVEIKISKHNKYIHEGLRRWYNQREDCTFQLKGSDNKIYTFYFYNPGFSDNVSFGIDDETVGAIIKTFKWSRPENNKIEIQTGTYEIILKDNKTVTIDVIQPIVLTIPEGCIDSVPIYGKYNFRHNATHTNLYETYSNTIFLNKLVSGPVSLNAYIPTGEYKQFKDVYGEIIDLEKVYALYSYSYNQSNFATTWIKQQSPKDIIVFYIDASNIARVVTNAQIVNPQIGLLQNIKIPDYNIDIDYDVFNIAVTISHTSSGGSGSSGSGSSGSGDDSVKIYAVTFQDVSDKYRLFRNQLGERKYIKNVNQVPNHTDLGLLEIPFNFTTLYSSNTYIEDGIFNIVMSNTNATLIGSYDNIIGLTHGYGDNNKIHLINSSNCVISNRNNFYIENCRGLKMSKSGDEIYPDVYIDGDVCIYNNIAECEIEIPIFKGVLKGNIQLLSNGDINGYQGLILNIDDNSNITSRKSFWFQFPQYPNTQKIPIEMNIKFFQHPINDILFKLSNIQTPTVFAPIIIQYNTTDHVAETDMLLSNGQWVKKSDYDEAVYQLISQTTQTNE